MMGLCANLQAVEAAVSEIHGLEEGDKVVLLSTMKAEGATLAKKLNQRLSDIGIVSKRWATLWVLRHSVETCMPWDASVAIGKQGTQWR